MLMKVLFFSKDTAVVEEIALALRLRWPYHLAIDGHVQIIHAEVVP